MWVYFVCKLPFTADNRRIFVPFFRSRFGGKILSLPAQFLGYAARIVAGQACGAVRASVSIDGGHIEFDGSLQTLNAEVRQTIGT